MTRKRRNADSDEKKDDDCNNKRSSWGFKVINNHSYITPHCPHGPCLLFERDNDGDRERVFRCAIYRSQKLCAFHHIVNDDDDRLVELQSSTITAHSSIFTHRGLEKRLSRLIAEGIDQLAYCNRCERLIIANKMRHRHHELTRSIDADTLRYPTRLLRSLQNNKGEAQYWFDQSSLNVITDAIIGNDIDGVLCVGTPTVFELLSNTKTTIACFLLDYDSRFMNFFGPKKFAQYSMLTDYVYSAKGAMHLDVFLGRISRLLIVCDPPFGVMISPLMHTLHKLELRHRSCRPIDSISSTDHIIALPYFHEQHVIAGNSLMKLTDFVVCYSNHKDFDSTKSRRHNPIRLYTTLPSDNFVLPSSLGYRYCSDCRRHVANSNVHCDQCNACTSKNGTTYRHCYICERCVKGTYGHCSICKRCHLKTTKSSRCRVLT